MALIDIGSKLEQPPPIWFLNRVKTKLHSSPCTGFTVVRNIKCMEILVAKKMDQIKGRNKLRYQSKTNIEADISWTKRELTIESTILKFSDCWSSHESTPGSFKIDNYLSPLNQVLKFMPWCMCMMSVYQWLVPAPQCCTWEIIRNYAFRL